MFVQSNLSPGEQYRGTLSEVPDHVQRAQNCSNSTKGNKFLYVFLYTTQIVMYVLLFHLK